MKQLHQERLLKMALCFLHILLRMMMILRLHFKNVDGTDATEGGSISEDGDPKILSSHYPLVLNDITLYYSDAGTGDATSDKDYTAIAPLVLLVLLVLLEE